MNKPAPLILAPGVVTDVPLDLIDIDPGQPRTEFDDARLAELSEDIARRGVRQPIELRVMDDGRYRVETGERRVRAARRAGLTHVRALLAGAHAGDDEDLERLLHQAIENVQREELSIVDKARLFRRLRDDHGIKVGELPEFLKARGLGEFSRPYISNLLRMIELPDWVVTEIRAGRIPASAAKIIGEIADLAPAMEALGKSFAEDVADTIDANGHCSEDDVRAFVVDTIDDTYQVVRGYKDDAPYYDLAEHADAVGLRTISNEFQSLQFITNPEAHQALQDEHPKPHPKSPAAEYPRKHGKPDTSAATTSKGSEGKGDTEKKPRTNLLEVRNVESIESYLLDWWKRYVSLHHREPRVIHAVLSWAAAGAPMNHEAHMAGWPAAAGISNGQHDACHEFKRPRLGAFLAHDLDDDERATLFDHLLEHMGKAAIADLVGHLKVKFEDVYIIDDEYLAFHNKATLEATVKKMGGGVLLDGSGKSPPDPAWTGCKKLLDMREYCIAHAATWRAENRTPADLAKVWKDLCKRVKS